VPSVLGVHSLFKLKMPLGTSMKAMRIGRLAFHGKSRGHRIQHRQGKLPRPLHAKKARRGMDFFKDYHLFVLLIWNGVLLTMPRIMEDHFWSSAEASREILRTNGVVVFFDPRDPAHRSEAVR